ncbi:hypothetical protein CDAR_106001 [Caerostris darwini]|uniref:Uncharacterized protein n=1 Tax=Caerostris darwini TaxID=1538125 RepID=A0AAV4TQG8_9ARAC|nr:hypothetical protein CDAR_106001 [Caerostris darwini]
MSQHEENNIVSLTPGGNLKLLPPPSSPGLKTKRKTAYTFSLLLLPSIQLFFLPRTTTESSAGQQVAPLQHPGGQRRLLRVQHQGLPLGARDGVEVRGSGAGHQHLSGGHRQQPVAGAAEGAEEEQGKVQLYRYQQ